MRIHRIRIDSFKGVRDRAVEFPDTGITVLQGRNESGKSSMIEAFDLLLEAPDSSGAKAVKAANPVGDDLGVAVEAEFTLEGHRLLYRKHWLRARKTTLRFLEGPRAGDALSGREAHDAVMALRERSDQTLWSVLRLLQGAGAGGERLTDSSALKSALERASGGSAQSESGSSLLALAQAERERYWTAGGKENAATKALRERHAQAVAEHESAAAELAGLVEAEERLERDERALAAAQRTLAAAEEDAEQARASADSLAHLQARREQAAAAAEAATSRAEQRRLDLAQRTALRTQAQDAAQRGERLREEVETLQAKADSAQEIAQQHRGQLDRVRAVEEEARRRVRALRAAQRLVRDRQRRAELTELLSQLDDLAQQLAALGQAPDSPITSQDVERIDAAERAVATARAQVAAGSAELSVTALDSTRTVHLGEEILELPEQQPQTRAVTEQIDLELPGLLRVSVVPEQGREQRRRAVDDAQEALRQALLPWEVESPQEARDLLREQTETQRERQTLEQRRRAVLAQNDEAELRREHERLGSQLAQPSQGSDPASAGAPASAGIRASAGAPAEAVASDREQDPSSHQDPVPAFEDAQEAAAALQEAEDAAEDARTALEAVRDDVSGAEAAASTRREELGAARASQDAQAEAALRAEQRLAHEREQLSDDALAASQQEADAELERAAQLRTQLEREWQDQDGEHKRSLYEARMRRPEALRRQLEQARDQRAQSRGALMALDRDQKQSAFDAALTHRRAVARELSTHLRRAAAARLLADTMERFQAEAHRRYTEPFRRQLERLGSYVFGSSFRVDLDEQLRVTRRFMHGSWIDEASLSTGAREQLAVLVRLAVATLVDPVDGVPVIFDDALGHSDPERLASLAGALESAGRQAQVILLTATPERFAAVADTAVVRIGD